jgi:hypothetical protein
MPDLFLAIGELAGKRGGAQSTLTDDLACLTGRIACSRCIYCLADDLLRYDRILLESIRRACHSETTRPAL